MTPKEKAKELVDRYFNDYGEKMPNGDFMLCVVSTGRAKQCALIAAQEVRNAFDDCQIQPILAGTLGPVEWDEVIKEIQNL